MNFKIISFVFCFLLGIVTQSYCQDTYSQILSARCTINDIKIDSFTLDMLSKKMGKPSIETKLIDEYDSKEILRVFYKKNHFDFKNNNLINFSINDSSFYFTRYKIRIGDSVAKIRYLFPTSWKYKELLNKSITNLRIDVDNTGKYILVVIKDKKISKIEDYNVLGYD